MGVIVPVSVWSAKVLLTTLLVPDTETGQEQEHYLIMLQKSSIQ